jgi:flagellar hook-length control protein FliK
VLFRSILPKGASANAPAAVPISGSLLGEQKKPSVERVNKPQLDTVSMTSPRGDKPAVTAATAELTLAATRPDTMIAPVSAQQAKIVAQAVQEAKQSGEKSLDKAVMRADASTMDLLQNTSEGPDPVAPTTAAGRSPLIAQPSSPSVPTAMAPAATLNLRTADWGKQLVGHIERMVENGSHRIELSLRPKNLGEIRVTLDVRGEQTLVHIVTETTSAARLLSGAEDRLAQVLDQSGYRLSGFSAQEQGTGAQGGQPGQQGQSSPKRNRPTPENTNREDPSDAATGGAYSADRKQSTGINMLA